MRPDCIWDGDRGNMEKFNDIIEQINASNNLAYTTYKPMVDDICKRENATEDELDVFLDWLVSACISDEMLELLRKVCKKYFSKYPDMIAEHILMYRELYESEIPHNI